MSTTTTSTSSTTTKTISGGGGGTTSTGSTLDHVSVSADQFAQLMADINGTQTQLDDKLAEFRDQIADSQERAATSAARKVQATQDMFSRRRVTRNNTKLTLLSTKPYTTLKSS